VPILSCTNIEHRYSDQIILAGVSLSVEAGDRIGIVGRNGEGKSTLLKALGGVLVPLKGSISLQRGCRAGYLQQDVTLDLNDTLYGAAERAFERLHELHEEQHAIYDKMATAQGDELQRLMDRISDIETQIDSMGGLETAHRIAEVLHGLGFTDAQFTQSVKGLSGGQRGRLALARLLLEQPDVLLLDEPTNHLDIDGRLWLENFLKYEFRGAVIMVSHDRYLLDNVVQRIIEVEQGRLIDYPGNYAAFRETRELRRTTQLRAFEKEQDRFRKEEAFIRRYKAGQRAKQARGRQSKLDRAKEGSTLERPMELDTFAFELPKAPRSGDMVVVAREATKTYPRDDGSTKTLFQNLEIKIERGERWGILGPNGAGKTTLVRAILGDLALNAGKVQMGANVVIGYYRQTHDGLNVDQTVVRYLQGVILKECPQQAMSEQQARNLAGAFLFSGDDQEKLLMHMSGGERSRAVLAGLLASAKNLIILDEPTNHLDIPSAERLEDALGLEGGYEGTLILISHDRAFIDATCDHLLILDGQGGHEIFAGTYSEWEERRVERAKAKALEDSQNKAKREEQERKRAEADKRKAEDAQKKTQQASATPQRANNSQPSQASAQAMAKGAVPGSNPKFIKMKTQQLEAKIEELTKKAQELDFAMMAEDAWKDTEGMKKLTQQRDAAREQLAELEEEWMLRAG
jgi:ATP-binding cassette subfamily F protein 3